MNHDFDIWIANISLYGVILCQSEILYSQSDVAAIQITMPHVIMVILS